MIPHADEIEALWQRVVAAQREYRAHPTSTTDRHGVRCAALGCAAGIKALRRTERKDA